MLTTGAGGGLNDGAQTGMAGGVLTAVLTPIVGISCNGINDFKRLKVLRRSIQPIHRKRESNYRMLSLIIALWCPIRSVWMRHGEQR